MKDTRKRKHHINLFSRSSESEDCINVQPAYQLMHLFSSGIMRFSTSNTQRTSCCLCADTAHPPPLHPNTRINPPVATPGPEAGTTRNPKLPVTLPVTLRSEPKPNPKHRAGAGAGALARRHLCPGPNPNPAQTPDPRARTRSMTRSAAAWGGEMFMERISEGPEGGARGSRRCAPPLCTPSLALYEKLVRKARRGSCRRSVGVRR